jgi:hypothetical protein
MKEAIVLERRAIEKRLSDYNLSVRGPRGHVFFGVHYDGKKGCESAIVYRVVGVSTNGKTIEIENLSEVPRRSFGRHNSNTYMIGRLKSGEDIEIPKEPKGLVKRFMMEHGISIGALQHYNDFR